MVSALVFKVKYGDSLRRFNSYVDENGLLAMDLDGLKTRILYLFNLSPDANLTLTYVDEDNDDVALVDEEDLYYAIQQWLNPMRITARLSCPTRGRAGDGMGRSSRYSFSDENFTRLNELFSPYDHRLWQGKTTELFDNKMNGVASSFPEFSGSVECLSNDNLWWRALGGSETDLTPPICFGTSKGSFSLVPPGDESVDPIHKSNQKELNKGNVDSNANALHLAPSLGCGNSFPDGAVKGVLKHDPIQQSLHPLYKFRGTNMSPVDVLQDSRIRHCVPGLGSLLIQDIKIKDGAKMKPTTSFTKNWRLCNNGTVVWPEDIQLVWIGGDKLTEKVSVQIQSPCGEIGRNDEVDIAVDFTAPEQPGRYSSYWRLALNTGNTFGQVVWVDIQVSTSMDDSKWNGGLRAPAKEIGEEVFLGPAHIVLTDAKANSSNTGTLSDVKRSTGSEEEDDKEKCFKKFNGKRSGMKRDGFNLNQLCGVSAWDLGLHKEESSDIEWIAHNYLKRQNQIKVQRKAKCRISAFNKHKRATDLGIA